MTAAPAAALRAIARLPNQALDYALAQQRVERTIALLILIRLAVFVPYALTRPPTHKDEWYFLNGVAAIQTRGDLVAITNLGHSPTGYLVHAAFLPPGPAFNLSIPASRSVDAALPDHRATLARFVSFALYVASIVTTATIARSIGGPRLVRESLALLLAVPLLDALEARPYGVYLASGMGCVACGLALLVERRPALLLVAWLGFVVSAVLTEHSHILGVLYPALCAALALAHAEVERWRKTVVVGTVMMTTTLAWPWYAVWFGHSATREHFIHPIADVQPARLLLTTIVAAIVLAVARSCGARRRTSAAIAAIPLLLGYGLGIVLPLFLPGWAALNLWRAGKRGRAWAWAIVATIIPMALNPSSFSQNYVIPSQALLPMLIAEARHHAPDGWLRDLVSAVLVAKVVLIFVYFAPVRG